MFFQGGSILFFRYTRTNDLRFVKNAAPVCVVWMRTLFAGKVRLATALELAFLGVSFGWRLF